MSTVDMFLVVRCSTYVNITGLTIEIHLCYNFYGKYCNYMHYCYDVEYYNQAIIIQNYIEIERQGGFLWVILVKKQ